MKKIFLGLVMLSLFATTSQTEVPLVKLLKDMTPELTDILKTEVSQYEAMRICKNKGMRLPTAREFALVAQSLGAEGLSETIKDGYYLVKGSDSLGNPDHFYFSEVGYRRPAGDLGELWFWSSSVDSDYSNYAYTFLGVDGDIETGNRNYDGFLVAVRCVRSR